MYESRCNCIYIIDDVGDEFTEACIERRQEENNSKR